MRVLTFPRPLAGPAPSVEAAHRLGIDALAFLAARPELVRRFLDLTGLKPDEIRTQAARLSFFVGLFDFLMANEDDLIDFAQSVDLNPAEVVEARDRLAAGARLSSDSQPR